MPARRGRGRARFDTISHEWLREPAKRWSRFRLATGCAFPTINAGALALARFSRFLAEHHPEVIDAAGITRPVLEDYLAWLLTCGYSPSTPSAEWVKHNLNRIRDSLPNGYCGRPAQQDCPHPNACLTCPDYQTTPQFLQIHRRQAANNEHN